MNTATSANLLVLARQYIDGGMSLVVVGQDKKALGAWKRRQTVPATIEEIARELRTPKAAGLAAVCGAASNNLLIIDFDEPGFYEQWLAQTGDDADGLPVQRTGGGGYQVAVRCDNPGQNTDLAWVPDPEQRTGRRIAIETRGEGGYAVLPGSLHPTGKRYEAIGDYPWTDIPCRAQASVDFMLDCARKLCQCPLTKQQQTAKPVNRSNLNGQVSVIDEFNKHNNIEDVLLAAGYSRFTHDRFTRPGADASPGGVFIREGKSFHHSTNDALNNGYWHDSFSVFTHYQHGGDVNEAVKAAAAKLGVKRTSDTSTTQNVVQQSQVERDIERWKIVPATELGDGEHIPWLLHGILARNFITLLTGLWKSGKTTFLSHLIHALDHSDEFMSQSVERAKVLVITEEGAGLWARRRDRLNFTDRVSFLCRPFRGRPSREQWEAFLQHVAAECRRHGIIVVIFDTISSLWPCDNENDAAKVIAALNPIHYLTEINVAPLLVHHPRKSDGGEAQSSRGSGALPGFVDTIIELRRFEPENPADRRRTLTGYGRFEETPPELVIELTDNEGYVRVGTRSEAAANDRWDVVTRILREQPSGKAISAELIRDQWPNDGVPKPGIRTLNTDLAKGWLADRWSREGNGVKGDPFLFYIKTTEGPA